MKLCYSPLPGRWALCQTIILDEDPSPESKSNCKFSLWPQAQVSYSSTVPGWSRPQSSPASGHLPSVQNPVRSPCDSPAPWNSPKVSSLPVDRKRYFAKQKKQCTVFSFVYFAWQTINTDVMNLLSDLNAEKHKYSSAFFPNTAFTHAVLRPLLTPPVPWSLKLIPQMDSHFQIEKRFQVNNYNKLTPVY